MPNIHIIDPDVRQRAEIAHYLSLRKIHAEIYDGLDEFGARPPKDGFVFLADCLTSDCKPSDITNILRKSGVALPVVMYAPQPAPERIVAAMLGGAVDYLQWPFNAGILNSTFRRLSSEADRWMAREALRISALGKIDTLTRREKQVLFHLADGLTNKEIGHALKISSRTVEIHRGNMMRKINAASIADVVRTVLYVSAEARVLPASAL